MKYKCTYINDNGIIRATIADHPDAPTTEYRISDYTKGSDIRAKMTAWAAQHDAEVTR